jgi:hypothetical protein
VNNWKDAVMTEPEKDVVMAEPEKIDTAFVTFEQGHPALSSRVKQGHKCCGGCCDVRRAVIIVNLISVFSVVFGLALFASALVRSDFEEKMNGQTVGMVIAILEMVFYGMGVYGAISYNQWLVASALALYSALVVYSIASVVNSVLMADEFWYFYFFGVLRNALFAYPHWFLIQEIRSGIMTVENYPNEKHSCCCV